MRKDETTCMTSRLRPFSPMISKRCYGHDREGSHIELVLRHTLFSSSRRPYDPCLGWIINLREIFTYLVALKTCVTRQLWRWQITKHTSCLQAQCTDVMGSRSRWCRIIMEWSVSVKVQACRAFHIEQGRRQMQLESIMDVIWSVTGVFRCKSHQRISVIIM